MVGQLGIPLKVILFFLQVVGITNLKEGKRLKKFRGKLNSQR